MNETLAGDSSEVRTFDKAGRLLTRDINNDSTPDYTATYNNAGAMTYDGKNYKYTFDFMVTCSPNPDPGPMTVPTAAGSGQETLEDEADEAFGGPDRDQAA